MLLKTSQAFPTVDWWLKSSEPTFVHVCEVRTQPLYGRRDSVASMALIRLLHDSWNTGFVIL